MNTNTNRIYLVTGAAGFLGGTIAACAVGLYPVALGIGIWSIVDAVKNAKNSAGSTVNYTTYANNGIASSNGNYVKEEGVVVVSFPFFFVFAC